ncbi:AMP-binding protein (plasmid) [Clostridium butyricum]|uniref:AMP-binding protein n=1 Tax=Clostridium butyricum TaxID=1492 RepID=UPI003D0A0A16
MFETLGEALKEISLAKNKGIYIVRNDGTEKYIKYNELYERASGILYNLQKNGIKEKDKVIFQIKENEDFITIFWACILGNIIPVPITVGANDEHKLKLYKIFNLFDSAFIIIDEDSSDRIISYGEKKGLNEIALNIKERTIFINDLKIITGKGKSAEAKSDDIAFIQFSSGSTGDPKGVILTHENLIYDTVYYNKKIHVTSKDIAVSWLPLTHDMGLIVVHIASLISGIDQLIIPTTLFVRNPTIWMKQVTQKKATITYSPNFGYKYFLKFYNRQKNNGKINSWDLSTLRYILNGAEPISSKILDEYYKEMYQYGLKKDIIHGGYGLAEGTVAVSLQEPHEKLATISLDRNSLGIGQIVKEIGLDSTESVTFVDEGYPIECCKVRICDEDNKVLDQNTVGHIQIKGNNVTRGYYNNEKATREIMTEDDWLITGDIGFLRDNKVFIIGRYKDIIFVNGSNYYAHDIERIAEEVEGIELGNIVAHGIYNDNLQEEEIILFIINRKSQEEFAEIAIKVKKYINRVAGIKISKVVPVRKIPKTTSGKVQRYALSQKYKNGEFKSIEEVI